MPRLERIQSQDVVSSAPPPKQQAAVRPEQKKVTTKNEKRKLSSVQHHGNNQSSSTQKKKPKTQKKKKKKKDPNEPKQTRSAYNFYCKDARPKIVAAGVTSMSNVNSQIRRLFELPLVYNWKLYNKKKVYVTSYYPFAA